MEFDSSDPHSVAADTPAQQLAISPLVRYVHECFERARRYRRPSEERWVKCYYNFRGLYGREVKFTDTETSRAFIKVTKVKVLASYGQLMDILLSTGKIPITIEPMRLPEGLSGAVHVDLQDPMAKPEDPTGGDEPFDEVNDGAAAVGYPGDGNDPKPGDTLFTRIGNYLTTKFKGAKFQEGPAVAPTQVGFSPADIAAKKMQKKVLDQLDESDADTHLRHCGFEMSLLGTGVFKGPFPYDKEYPQWDDQGNYKPVTKTIPRFESPAVWHFYPDPEAKSIEDCDFTVERHPMTRAQIRDLRRRPFFSKQAIERVLDGSPDHEQEWWENILNDNDEVTDSSRWDVLEYWGNVDSDMLDEFNVTIPKGMEEDQEFQVNVWVAGGEVLRCVLNPYTPRRLPYFVVPYELNPYSIFGVGAAENMEDLQTLMNGFLRMAIDNAVLAGNIMIEVDETNLVPGQDMKTYPGKVWKRQGGPPGQSIFATHWPNVASDNMIMFDKFRQMADEATGIPSVSHGQTGVSGTGRTASGLSMLMGAASMSIKTVVKNLDDYLLAPLGQSLYAFNMQFDFDPELQGMMEVRARGTSSLMQKEVRSQRIMTFIQVASSPAIAPLVKFPTLIRELAEDLDLDPDKCLNNPDEAMLAAKLMQMAMGQPGAPPAGASPTDPTGAGGGNIGTAPPPMPGAPGFGGNAQPQPGAAPPAAPANQAGP